MTKPVLLRSNYLYVLGLILLLSSLPLSKYVMSLSQFVLAGSFFFEGSIVNKLKRFFSNKAALVIVGILLMHVIGMLWTQNPAEGWKDIRIKLPILSLTFMIAASEPLNNRQFKLVLGFFFVAVFAGTLVSMAVLAGMIHHTVYDIRDVFIFKISHIRFALLTDVAIFVLLYFIFTETGTLKKILFSIIAAWFIIFLFVVESLTGLSVLFIISVLLLIYYGWKSSHPAWKLCLIGLAVLIPIIIFFQLRSIYDDYYSAKPFPINVNDKTAEGNSYTFDLNQNEFENGYPIGVYLCEDELKKEWNNRSSFNYDSTDNRKQIVKYTLIRFLTSKGWRKDGEAVKKLTPEEVHSVENGIANVNYQHISNLRARLVETVWEYDHFIRSGDASGQSAMQRLVFWKAAVGIIKDHPLIGVGTGDMPIAYPEQYRKMNTKLGTNYWIRSHNQYLAIAVAFGCIGLFYFLFALIYPMFALKKTKDYFYLTFLLIALISMLTEDTLETQAGATFFAFFNAFFLFGRKGKDD